MPWKNILQLFVTLLLALPNLWNNTYKTQGVKVYSHRTCLNVNVVFTCVNLDGEQVWSVYSLTSYPLPEVNT